LQQVGIGLPLVYDQRRDFMPRLIRLYILQVAIGFVISAAFVGMLLWFNVMNLWHLVSHSSDGILAVFLLWLFNGIVFAGVQFAIQIMLLARDGDHGPRGSKRKPIHVDLNTPVRVKADARPRDPFSAKR
jgi:dolichyl-phosphate-mannose--protein O-mannosyl transferase